MFGAMRPRRRHSARHAHPNRPTPARPTPPHRRYPRKLHFAHPAHRASVPSIRTRRAQPEPAAHTSPAPSHAIATTTSPTRPPRRSPLTQPRSLVHPPRHPSPRRSFGIAGFQFLCKAIQTLSSACQTQAKDVRGLLSRQPSRTLRIRPTHPNLLVHPAEVLESQALSFLQSISNSVVSLPNVSERT